MTLNRRYLRNVKSNISFYLCIIILTAIVVCADAGFLAAYQGEKNYLDSIRDELNCESGQFMTYHTMTEEDIADIKKEFDADIERLSYYDSNILVGDRNVELRIYQPTQLIDKYKITVGSDLSSDTDILINPLFAGRQGIKVGDTIELDGVNYTVCGFAVRLDYMFCLKNVTDIFSNADSFGIGIVTEKAFHKKDSSQVASYYAIKYNKDNELEVRKAIYERFMTAIYTARDNNNRITTPEDQLAEIRTSVQLILPVAVFFVVILIAVVLGRKVKTEQKLIGILGALGYRKWELAFHYSLFGAIPGIIGSIIGYVASMPLKASLVELTFESKLEPLNIHYSLGVKDTVIALICPTIAYVLAIFITALWVMRGSSISMIRGISEKKKKHSMRMQKSKFSFRTKYKIRAIFGNISRTLIVIGGIGISGLLLVFCYSCIDSLEVYVEKSVDEIGEFEYEYFLNSINTGEPQYGAPAIAASFAVGDYTDSITVMGMEDTSYINLNKEDGEEYTLENDQFYISQMAALIYGVGKGDTLSFYDVSSLKEYTVTIDGVFVNGSQSLLVSTSDSICKLLDLPQGSYNVIMSDKELDYTDSELIKEIVKADFSEQLKNNILKNMYNMMGAMIGIGMLILIVCVFLMVNVLLTESTAAISMLKVLGYHESEINRIVTHIYHALLPFGVMLGLVLGYYANKINFIKSVAVYNTYIEATMSAASVVKYVVITVSSYIIAILLLGNKVKKIDMVESLKNNRE